MMTLHWGGGSGSMSNDTRNPLKRQLPRCWRSGIQQSWIGPWAGGTVWPFPKSGKCHLRGNLATYLLTIPKKSPAIDPGCCEPWDVTRKCWAMKPFMIEWLMNQVSQNSCRWCPWEYFIGWIVESRMNASAKTWRSLGVTFQKCRQVGQATHAFINYIYY